MNDFTLAKAHHNAGRFLDAEQAYRRVLDADPENVVALNLLGTLERQRGRLAAAAEYFARATGIEPGYPEYPFNLADIWNALGEPENAIATLRDFVELVPGNADAHFHLGLMLVRQGDLDGAIADLEAAREADGARVAVHCALGSAFLERGGPGDKEKSLASFQHAAELDPRSQEALVGFASANAALGHTRDAAIAFQKLRDLTPDSLEALNNLGAMLMGLDQTDAAIETCRQALALDPDCADTHFNLARIHAHKGDLENAIRACRRILELAPEDGEAALVHLEMVQQACQWPELERAGAQLDRLTDKAIENQAPIAESLAASLSRWMDPARNFQVAKGALAGLARRAGLSTRDFPPHIKDPQSARITLGYFSGHFHDHPLAHQTAAMFALHDRHRFKVIAYAHGPNDPNPYRRRISEGCDKFLDCNGVNNTHLAKKIWEDEVDILIYMDGYAPDSRLEVCALHAPPLQIAYCGFSGTSGADFFDYLITDETVSPAAEADYYCEKLLYMPDTFSVTDTRFEPPEGEIARAELNLPESGFVFACFADCRAFEPLMFDQWMALLKQVAGSVLWLAECNRFAMDNLRAAAARADVAPERLVFAPRLPRDAHLARLGAADLILDTRVLNDFQGTVDALSAGVPVIATMGGHYPSRTSASILAAGELDELICEDLEAYGSLALELAGDRGRLLALREKISHNRAKAPLFDTARWVRNLEAGLTQAWERHLSGTPPETIQIAPHGAPKSASGPT